MPLDDPFLHKQLRRHERFHLNCKAEKRNTTEGVVLWELCHFETLQKAEHELKLVTANFQEDK